MGTVYFAVNHQTKKAYGLDKGDWFNLVKIDANGHRLISVTDTRLVSDLICKNVFSDCQWGPSFSDMNGLSREEYATMIANDLSSIGPVIEVISEYYNEEDALDGFSLIGDRYGTQGDWLEEKPG